MKLGPLLVSSPYFGRHLLPRPLFVSSTAISYNTWYLSCACTAFVLYDRPPIDRVHVMHHLKLLLFITIIDNRDPRAVTTIAKVPTRVSQPSPRDRFLKLDICTARREECHARAEKA